MKNTTNSRNTDSAGTPSRPSATRSNRILVADDDIDLLLLSAEMLFRSGYQVDTAQDGETAWEALQARTYDLLITDNNMPKVSGVELVKKLRSARMGLPVILASGVLPEDLSRDSSLLLAATLQKPFTGDELVGTVMKVLHTPGSAREQIEPRLISQRHPTTGSLRV